MTVYAIMAADVQRELYSFISHTNDRFAESAKLFELVAEDQDAITEKVNEIVLYLNSEKKKSSRKSHRRLKRPVRRLGRS